MKRALLLLACHCFSLFADEVGPEVTVTEHAAVQQNVVIWRDSFHTLVAMEEPQPDGQPSRIVLHQYEGMKYYGRWAVMGRETYVERPSPRHQRRPVLSDSILAWVEEDPATGKASLWFDPFIEEMKPIPPLWKNPKEVAAVKPGTRIVVFHPSWTRFVWTAPAGNLMSSERPVMSAIAMDTSPYEVTYEPAENPSTGVAWGKNPLLVAYNTPGPSGGQRIRATTITKAYPKLTVDIAPEGASAPKVVFNGVDYVVFWSMENGSTYAQRVSTVSGRPLLVGEAVKIHDGVLHDATLGPGKEYYLAVHEGVRYALLRVDASLTLAERTTFYANPAAGATLSLSGDEYRVPMLAYPDVLSRAVLREVEDRDVPRRRRSAR